MPVFETATMLACSPAKAFEFLVRPANLPLVTPPDMNVKLVDAPERLALGARITLQGSKFGIAQKIVSVVTAFEEGAGFTDQQESGPFGKFVHSHRVERHDTGTQMFDRIEYESPGGLVGLYLTNDRIRRDLESLAAYRTERFKALLET